MLEKFTKLHVGLSCLSRALPVDPRDSQFVRGERKLACRDGADLVCRRVLHAREQGVSNTLLGDQREGVKVQQTLN